MKNPSFDDLYNTLMGVMGAEQGVPGVENAFAPGSYCARMYDHLTTCRERLWQQLGDSDHQDLEQILCDAEAIQRELCRLIFEYTNPRPPHP